MFHLEIQYPCRKVHGKMHKGKIYECDITYQCSVKAHTMYPPPRLRNKTLTALQLLQVLKKSKERLSLLSKGMGNIKETPIILTEVKITMSEIEKK